METLNKISIRLLKFQLSLRWPIKVHISSKFPGGSAPGPRWGLRTHTPAGVCSAALRATLLTKIPRLLVSEASSYCPLYLYTEILCLTFQYDPSGFIGLIGTREAYSSRHIYYFTVHSAMSEASKLRQRSGGAAPRKILVKIECF